MQHHVFVNTLRLDTTNLSCNSNGDWGGRSGKFGVFGRSRSERCLHQQTKTRSHQSNNRVRSSYRKYRSQIGKSNRTNIYSTIQPPKTAPIIKKPVAEPFFKLSPSRKKRCRSATKKRCGRKKSKFESNPYLQIKNIEQIAQDAVRFQPQFEDYYEEDNNLHPIFQSSQSTSKLIEFQNNQENLYSNNPNYTMHKSQSDSVLLKRDKNQLSNQQPHSHTNHDQFLTTSTQFYDLRLQSPTKELMSPGKRKRIQTNQKRISEYVKLRNRREQLKDQNNILQRKNLKYSYDQKVDQFKKYEGKQELLKRKGGYGHFSKKNTVEKYRQRR